MPKFLRISICAALIFCALLFLYIYNPVETTWAPKCWIKMLTGFDCPACGGQRAVHALLHGKFIEAIAYNPFMVLSVPYALLATCAATLNLQKLKQLVFHRYTLIAYLILLFVWWIVRNL